MMSVKRYNRGINCFNRNVELNMIPIKKIPMAFFSLPPVSTTNAITKNEFQKPPCGRIRKFPLHFTILDIIH